MTLLPRCARSYEPVMEPSRVWCLVHHRPLTDCAAEMAEATEAALRAALGDDR